MCTTSCPSLKRLLPREPNKLLQNVHFSALCFGLHYLSHMLHLRRHATFMRGKKQLPISRILNLFFCCKATRLYFLKHYYFLLFSKKRQSYVVSKTNRTLEQRLIQAICRKLGDQTFKCRIQNFTTRLFS